MALRRGEIRLVLLASDGSTRDGERVTRLTEERGVPIRTVATREALGSWVGQAAVAVLGVRDPHLATAVREAFDGASARPRDNGEK
jgi:ribosomal protein L7Ae-like RNA K-turn-binding protein